MSEALHIFAGDNAVWSDRTRAVAGAGTPAHGSDARQRLLALAAALGAWSLVAMVGGLVWLAIG